VCQHTGELPRVESFATEALAITRKLGWLSHEAEALSALADLRIAQGRAEHAVPMLTQALARSRECALPYPECTSLLLAKAYHALHDTRQATTTARAAAAIARRCDYLLLAAQAARLTQPTAASVVVTTSSPEA
jgi:hypothetical protein